MWIKEQAIARALGRLIAAAAWADSEVSPEERECFKDILFQMPAIEEEDWQELERYLDAPMSDTDRQEAQEDFARLVKSEEEREFAFYALDQLVAADGEFRDEEKSFLAELRQAVDQLSLPSMRERVYGVLRSPVHRRNDRLQTEAAIRDPELFRSVLFCQQQQDESARKPEKAALCGAMLRRVIHDGQMSSGLEVVIRASLKEKMGFGPQEEDIAIRTASHADAGRLDLLRLSRHFYANTAYQERVAFLDVLFAVAENSDHFDTGDLDEIINLAANMRLSQDDFQIAFNQLLERWAPVIEKSELVDFRPREEGE